MNTLILAITTLVVLVHLTPAYAEASEPVLAAGAYPISGLIGDWPKFRSAILAKTKRYDRYSDIMTGAVRSLPKSLQGTWRMASNRNKPGYRQHALLRLGPNQKFSYKYVVTAGKSQQEWDLSGQWEEKNRILMLLVDHSSYPGVEKNQILFWRLLHVDQAKLLFVRSGADEMVAMTRTG
jgi:hypothetical protein